MTDPTDRLPPIPPDAWTPAQREVAQAVINGPRGGLLGPFVPLLRSPELMTHAQAVGAYLRYRSAIGQRLTEFAILVIAQRWRQQVEWDYHAPLALDAGVDARTVAALGQGHKPTTMTPDEALVYDFCMALEQQRSINDDLWQSAVARLGEHGVVDLLGINGYYTLLAMVMNAARTTRPGLREGTPPLSPSANV
jgi:4-carboxymuconolactone decarboxylase